MIITIHPTGGISMTTIQTTGLAKSKTTQWQTVLEEHYDKFLSYGQKAVKDFDDEDVHQARVNCRKLMTLLRILDASDQAGLIPLLKKSQKALGKVRDADVMIDAFKERKEDAKADDHKDEADLLKAVIKAHKQERKEYRTKLAKKLPKLQGKILKKKWKTLIEDHLETLAAQADVNRIMRELEIAYEQQKRTYRQTAKTEGIDSVEALHELHQLRIAAKEIRYTASAAEFALSSKFRDSEEVYKKIQTQLGHINDKRVWVETLEDFNPKKLKVDEDTWNTFMKQLQQELNEAIHEQQAL